MVNRPDAYTAYGGDTLQMTKTAVALRHLGVRVDEVLASELSTARWDYDLVHLFNIQTAQQSLDVAREVKRRQIPLLLSTIYWDPLPGWYHSAAEGSPVWGPLSQAVGRRRAYPLYRAWQRQNYPRLASWQQQRELLNLADWILPNSRAELVQLAGDFRLSRERQVRASVVVSGIDKMLYAELPAKSQKWRQLIGSEGFVLEVGRLSPEKNTLGLIEALAHVDIPLVFVGKPSPYSTDYVAACRRRALARANVHFVDFVPYEELPGLYALAAVHALPSWRETPGLVTLEAAAAGCKVVSTTIGCAQEYLGEHAWYCDPREPASITTAVARALSASGDGGLREHVLDAFTWDRAAEATLAAYQRVLGAE